MSAIALATVLPPDLPSWRPPGPRARGSPAAPGWAAWLPAAAPARLGPPVRGSPATRGAWVRAASGLWLPAFLRRPSPRPSAASRRPTTNHDPLLADLHLLAARLGDDAGRLAALERVVAAITWHPPSPAVRRALQARALGDGCSTAEVKLRELRAAVYLVLAERTRPQPHRFGRAWLTDEAGRAATLIPEQLPPDLFRRWFADEVRKAAEASVLGRGYPTDRGWRGEPLSAQSTGLDALAGPAPDPLFVLVRREDRAEAAEQWQSVLATATPRQRDLLAALADGPTISAGAASPSPGPDATLAATARRLGMAPSTARVQWKRLLDRHRPRRP